LSAPCGWSAARSPARPRFPPERLARAIAQAITEIRRHLVNRRRRANPRVVKRKMSNFGVKRAKHRAWPQPTKPADQAVVIVGPTKPAPTPRRARKPSSQGLFHRTASP
jgi:hypothetical protein